jgi:hypothetical protein
MDTHSKGSAVSNAKKKPEIGGVAHTQMSGKTKNENV